MPEDIKPQEKSTESPSVGFPILDKGPAVFYDNDRHQVWIGLPLEQVNDPTMLMAAIDWSKLQTLAHRNDYIMQLMKRKQFEASPTGERISKMLKGIWPGKEHLVIQ